MWSLATPPCPLTGEFEFALPQGTSVTTVGTADFAEAGHFRRAMDIPAEIHGKKFTYCLGPGPVTEREGLRRDPAKTSVTDGYGATDGP